MIVRNEGFALLHVVFMWTLELPRLELAIQLL